MLTVDDMPELFMNVFATFSWEDVKDQKAQKTLRLIEALPSGTPVDVLAVRFGDEAAKDVVWIVFDGCAEPFMFNVSFDSKWVSALIDEQGMLFGDIVCVVVDEPQTDSEGCVSQTVEMTIRLAE